MPLQSVQVAAANCPPSELAIHLSMHVAGARSSPADRGPNGPDKPPPDVGNSVQKLNSHFGGTHVGGRPPAFTPVDMRRATPPNDGDTAAPIWFSPHGLAGTGWERWAGGALTIGLFGVFLAGLLVPTSVETLPAALLILVAAAWLFSTRTALAITAVALALPLAETIYRELDPASAALQEGVFALLAIGTHVYSTRLHTLLIGNGRSQASFAAAAFGLENLARLMEGSTQGEAAIDSKGAIRYANAAALELIGTQDGAGRIRLYDRVTAEDRDRVRAAFEANGSGGVLTFSIHRPDGAVARVQATHTHLVVRDEPMVALALRDISQISDLQRAANALAETAASLAVTQPLEETLAAIARRVIEVTHACACAVFLLEGERSVRLAGSSGLPPGYEVAANQAIKAGANPPVFQAVRTGLPVFVDDLLKVIRTEDHMAPMRDLVRNVAWRKAIAFPMVHAGRPLGALSVYLRPDHEVDEPTMEFLSTIAGQAASAAEISRLVGLAQGQAAANERLHLSRELHDSLSQRLFGIILGARSIDVRPGRPPEDVAESVEYILDLAEGGLTEMREIVLQLRPEAVETEGLIAAVNHHTDTITARHQLEVISSTGAEPDVPLDVKVAAYRIAVEALNNVAKHACAAHVWLRIEVIGRSLEVEVRDDGAGFDLAHDEPGHFGLRTMRERAGELEVRSSPGHGTMVLARFPMLVSVPDS
jgi:signal transduction histidine kinase